MPSRPGPPPTIRDVAAAAGVSKSLVSLVLHDSPNVRPDKRAAVQRAVADLGYRPNAAARSLAAQRTRTVGVLLNDLRQPFFVDALDALSEALHGHDLTMLLGDLRLDRRADERLLQAFVEMRVDGLVLMGSMTPDPAILAAATRLPTVAVAMWDIDIPRVDVSAQDDAAGGRLAARHLLDLGHRRIRQVGGTTEAALQERARAFADTLRERGLDSGELVPGELTEEAGYLAGHTLLRPRDRPTAIFAGADSIALGVLRAARELGLAVPHDVSVLGYDNALISRAAGTALTTIDLDNAVMGTTAVELLVDRIQDPGRRRRVRRTTPTLCLRATTAPPSEDS